MLGKTLANHITPFSQYEQSHASNLLPTVQKMFALNIVFGLTKNNEIRTHCYKNVPLDVNHCMCCVCNFIVWFKYICKAPENIFHSGHNIIVRMFESNTEVMTQSLLMCGELIRINLVIGGQNYNPHWIQTQMKSKYEPVLRRIRFWTACFWKICYRIPLMSRPAL